MAFAFNILSASIKSRLLRYALSRIEFLDHDALDLDRLDFTWGKKNVLALRHVGLNVAKLTSLLSLPPGLTLIKASVRDLRITIPADLSTGICIEVDGVIIKTKVVQDLRDNDKTSRKSVPGAASGPSREAIPTTEDLAKSFLLEEPPEEKRELEAAIGAQSQYLQESTAEASNLSDDSPEASELGTGVGLSLPSVVTNFLDGVRDKLQVSIKNVELQLDMEVPPDGWDNDDALGPATAVFHIGRVDLEGLTVTSSSLGQDNVEDSSTEDTKANKRKLTLEILCAGILLDERVMSKSRVTVSSPESPAAARSVPRPDFSSTHSQGSSFHSSASTPGFHNPRTSTPSMAGDSVPLSKSNQMMKSSISTDDGKFADADEGSSGSQHVSQMEQSTVFGMHLPPSLDEDEPSHEQDFGISSSSVRPGDGDQFDLEQALSHGHVPDGSSSSPRQSSPDLRFGSSRPVYNTSSHKSSPSPTREHDDLSGNAESYHSTIISPNVFEGTQEKPSPTNSGPSAVDDLEQSRLFTYEETESLYMSAVGDEKDESERDESERDFKMPGGWESASTTSSESGPDRARSTTSGRMKRESLGTIRENEEGLDTPRVQSPVNRAPSGHSAGEEQTHADDDSPDATRIYYPLFDVDIIGVWLPQPGSSHEDPDPPESPQPARASKVSFEEASVFGSFSQYAASTARSRVGSSLKDARRPSFQPESPPRDSRAEHLGQNPSLNHAVEVEVGKVRLQMDVDFIYLAMSILKSLQDWPAGPEQGQESNTRRAARADHKIALELSISDIQIALLNQLSSHGIEPSPFVGPLQHAPWNSGDVLLKSKISNATLSVIGLRDDLEVHGKIGTLRLGFNDSDILSFSPASSLDETTVRLDPPQESEISWQYVKKDARSEIHITALPMHTALDVQKLDETFASHGGLSGVLRIGKNIKSTCSLPSSPPRKKPTAGAAGELSPTPMKMPKVNIVLGGFDFVLQGESCAALLETSRVKIAARDQLFGISVRHARLSGPHPTHTLWTENVSVQATLDDVDIRYTFTPAEADLAELLALITPSKYKYEADDDILIDTLMAQRRKGSLIKVNAHRGVQLEISELGGLDRLKQLGNDVAKLSSVAKLLPDDERPGLLSIIEAAECGVAINVNDKIGRMSVIGRRLQIAHVGLPSLIALAVGSLESQRGEQQTLIDQVSTPHAHDADIPSLMARILGDEMEPTVKIKLFNVLIDYHVDVLVAILGLTEPNETEELANGPHDSVATIKRPHSPDNAAKQSSASSERYGSATQPMNLDIQLSDCAVGLNPRNSSAKALLVLSDARVSGALLKDVATTVKADIRKASLLIIDDVRRLARDDMSNVVPRSAELGSRQVVELCRLGFVSVGTTSKAKATIKITELEAATKQIVDVEFNNDLFVMETCADSTQTLIAIFGGLAPPQRISQAVQYRTKVEPVLNMMASLAGETLQPEQQGEIIDMDQSVIVDDDEQNLHFMGSFYDPDQLPSLDQMTEESVDESKLSANLADALKGREDSGEEDLELDFQEDFFGSPSTKRNVAQAWNSRKNEYVESSDVMGVESPLTVHVHDVHFIWNLYDGYDWPETRDRLGQKLEEVQQRAQDRRDRRHGVDDDDGVTIEEDLLFGSIYIALPIHQTPQENARQINRAMKGGDDTVSETSYATTTATGTSSRPGSTKVRLKLERGRHHKITFELKGIAADFVAFPPGASETQTSIDVRVRDLDVIDHVPTSTWRKFMTYDRDAGERPLDSPFLKLEVLNVRPVLDLAATELVIRVSVLPVRLHVDQDALDFITRFFEFKDDRASHSPSPQAEQPFIQRLEVKTVKLKLDYKPKQVDYAGLRSGHTTEFMNFVILDGANIVLRRCIVYGISGFDKVHKTLNDIWMPDVKRNQIPSILAGLATVRPIANVGSGFRNFVTVPMSEYRKDGRLVRAVQKGAIAAAKTTGIELLRLGAKVSIGTQAVIQGAEGLLSPASKSLAGNPSHHHHGDTDWEDLSPNGSPSGAGANMEPRAFSNYADQPIGVRAGLISARRHLQADFASARDAIIAIPGEIMESGSASGAAWVIARNAPVLVVRPLAAAAKASGAALFGAANAMDKESARRIDEKYKRLH